MLQAKLLKPLLKIELFFYQSPIEEMIKIPTETVLEIVKHFHKKEATSTHICGGGYCDICKQHRGIHTHRLTETEEGDVKTALNLRLVGGPLARACEAYNAKYIYKNIGGTFGRKQHADVLIRNTQLWWNQLRNLAGMETTNEMLSRYANDVKSIFRRRTYMEAVLRHIDDFIEDSTLIFDIERVGESVKKWVVDYLKSLVARSYPYAPAHVHNDQYPELLPRKKTYVGFYYKIPALPASSTTLTGRSDIRSITMPVSTKASNFVRYDETDSIYRDYSVFYPNTARDIDLYDDLNQEGYVSHPGDLPEGEKVDLTKQISLTKHLAIASRPYSEQCRQSMLNYMAKETFWVDEDRSMLLKWAEAYGSRLSMIARSFQQMQSQIQIVRPNYDIIIRGESLHLQTGMIAIERLPDRKEVVPHAKITELRRKRFDTKNTRASLMRKTKTTPTPMKNRYKKNYR